MDVIMDAGMNVRVHIYFFLHKGTAKLQLLNGPQLNSFSNDLLVQTGPPCGKAGNQDIGRFKVRKP